MRFQQVEQFLTQAIGLDSASIGTKSVERAVLAGMERTATRSEAAYLALLKGSEAELAALIESVVVPETWFFRDQGPFAYLRQYVLHEWKPLHKNRMLRLLSVPCSTGEEPFSVAITLVEAGLGHRDFSIDAVDISERALQTAERGIYGKSSFREKDEDFVARYFSQTADGMKIHESIRNSVCFERGNILDPAFPVNRSSYHVIFCRNLLIYMTQPAKKRILDVLDGMLVDGGLLFTGHTETMLVRSYGYSIVKYPRGFACKKGQISAVVRGGAPEKKRSAAGRAAFPVRPPPVSPAPVVPRNWSQPTEARASIQSTGQESPEAMLDRVRQLGNRGALEEAAALCEQVLQKHSLNSEAYYLMGLLHDAADKHDLAEQCFLKSLYLDPDNYQVLVKLYLLYEHRGDSSRAKTYRERAARAQAQPKDGSTG